MFVVFPCKDLELYHLSFCCFFGFGLVWFVWFQTIQELSSDAAFFKCISAKFKVGHFLQFIIAVFRCYLVLFRPCNKQFKLNFYSEAQHQH